MNKLSDMLRDIALGQGMSEPVDGCEASKRRVLMEAADELESQEIKLITMYADMYYLKKDISKTRAERDAALAGFLRYDDINDKGLMVILPCKVGDTIYAPKANTILKNKVDEIHFDNEGLKIWVHFKCDHNCEGCPHFSLYTNYWDDDGGCNGEYGEGTFSFADLGKTVFLTREEAEAAMKGRQHANH